MNGFKSANAAEEHLQALARKGVIELVSGTSAVYASKRHVALHQRIPIKQFSLLLSGYPAGAPIGGPRRCLLPILARSMWTRPIT